MENNVEGKQTLYCFKVVENDGKTNLECWSISEYLIRKKGVYDSQEIIFKGKHAGMTTTNVHINMTNLDRFLNGKVYTFDSNWKHAEYIISQAIKDKRCAIKRQLTQVEQLTTSWCDFLYDKYRD